MKKIFMVFMVLLMVLTFIGCGEEDATEPMTQVETEVMTAGMGAVAEAFSIVMTNTVTNTSKGIALDKASYAYTNSYTNSYITINWSWHYDDIHGTSSWIVDIIFTNWPYNFTQMNGEVHYEHRTTPTTSSSKWSGHYTYSEHEVSWDIAYATDYSNPNRITWSYSGTFTMDGKTRNVSSSGYYHY